MMSLSCLFLGLPSTSDALRDPLGNFLAPGYQAPVEAGSPLKDPFTEDSSFTGSAGGPSGGDDASLPLTKTSQGWYAVDVNIDGSPARLAVDTGSSSLWLRPRAGASNATSSGESFHVRYGRGTVAGSVLSESVAFGAAPQNCKVGSATEESSFWAKQTSIDGLLGLGCGGGQTPVSALDCAVGGTATMSSGGAGGGQLFALSLTSEGGSLSLGKVPASYGSSLKYLPTSNCGRWSVPLHSLSLAQAGKDQQNVLSGEHEAIIDSGSNGIVGPAEAVASLAQQFGASPAPAGEGYDSAVKFFTAPCSQPLPDLAVRLGSDDAEGVSVMISGQYLMAGGSYGGSGDLCRLRLVGFETSSWILGRVFLTQLDGVVFDVDGQRVGFAQ